MEQMPGRSVWKGNDSACTLGDEHPTALAMRSASRGQRSVGRATALLHYRPSMMHLMKACWFLIGVAQAIPEWRKHCLWPGQCSYPLRRNTNESCLHRGRWLSHSTGTNSEQEDAETTLSSLKKNRFPFFNTSPCVQIHGSRPGLPILSRRCAALGLHPFIKAELKIRVCGKTA